MILYTSTTGLQNVNSLMIKTSIAQNPQGSILKYMKTDLYVG